MTLEIRPAARADAEAIATIYDWYIEHTPITFDLEPLSPGRRDAWFDEHPGGRHLALVAIEGPDVLGYATSGRFRSRPAYDPSVETSVYVRHDRVGERIGSRLYAALFAHLEHEDVHRAFAGIALPNVASEVLHARFGFRHVGTFTEQGRKFGRYWDVAWFEREMPGARP